MNTNPDFKQLWQQQPAATPNLESFLGFARDYRKKQSVKKWKANAMLGITVFFIAYIVSRIDGLEWTTLAGALIVMLAVLLYLVMYNRLFAALGGADYKDNNREYLQRLLVYQRRQQFLQRRGISGYFILLCAGLALYMVPFLRRMTPLIATMAVLLTAGWIAFSWFYFRPRTQKRETAELDALIKKCEALNRQWETQAEAD